MKSIHILLVEDNEGDILLTKEALEDSKIINKITVIRDGAAAIAFFESLPINSENRPNLVLLDINLPKKSGQEVLQYIKGNSKYGNTPVIMLTTSSSDRDITLAYNNHANCYITKPVDVAEFIHAVGKIEDFWINIVTIPKKLAMRLQNRHILVVEDNLGDFTLVEDFIIDCLEDSMILHARTFAEAKSILLAKDWKCDIVLLDLSLPDLTGAELIREIIDLCDKTPVVVLTGYTDFEFGIKSLSMGISDYLLKDDLTANSLYKSIIYSTERKRIALELEGSEKRARGFARRLNMALEDERAHMAREIHDEFGQHLSGLKMSLSAMKKQQPTGPALNDFVNTLISDLDSSIESVRRLANELRPVLIDKLGLFAAIEWLVVEFGKKTGASSSFLSSIDQMEINKDIEINIFRICQEALTNTAKHAHATEVAIEVSSISKRLVIKISDNGKGMAPEVLHHPLSMGLMNMNERAQLIGATLKINNLVPTGTLIELTMDNYDK